MEVVGSRPFRLTVNDDESTRTLRWKKGITYESGANAKQLMKSQHGQLVSS